MTKVAIYSRKSKFTGKGESIQNQIELCKGYADNHFDVDKFSVYEDEGYSGGNINRPKFQKLLKDIKNKKIDLLICYRLDRISRNISDFSNLIELLEIYDVNFVSIREQFDTSTPMGRAMMYITSVFAQLERETIAERIRDNMYQLARSGRWLGGKTPTGFVSEQIEYYDDDNNKRKVYRLSPIEDELKLVITLYNKYLKLGSLTKLDSWALENDIKSRNNKHFDKSALKIILSNPVYAIADELLFEYFNDLKSDIANDKADFDSIHGLMVYNKHNEKKNRIIKRDVSDWIVAVGEHEGIIPSDKWIKVQKLLEENSKKSPRVGTGNVGLITPLLRCKSCGSKMRVTNIKKSYGTYYYYKCILKERSKGSKCNVSNLNGKLADEQIVNEIIKIGFNKEELYNHLFNSKEELLKSLHDDIKSNKSHLKNELSQYEDSIKNLTEQLAQNKNSHASKYIINQIEEYDKKIKELKSKLETIEETKENVISKQSDLKNILNLIRNFSKNADKLEFSEKRKLLNDLIDEILWDGTKLEINIKNH